MICIACLGRTVVFVNTGHNAIVTPQMISPVLELCSWTKLMTQGHVMRTSLISRSWRVGGWLIWAVYFPWTEPMAPTNEMTPGQNNIGRTDHHQYHYHNTLNMQYHYYIMYYHHN